MSRKALSQLACAGAGGQRPLELIARGDAQLAEDLPQVVGDRVLADDQARSDLAVGKAVPREPCDLSLLRGEIVTGVHAAFPDAFAGRQQLSLGPRGERLGAHAREHLERGAQLLARVKPAPLAPKPFAVDEVGAGELQAQARASQAFDRLPIAAVGSVAV